MLSHFPHRGRTHCVLALPRPPLGTLAADIRKTAKILCGRPLSKAEFAPHYGPQIPGKFGSHHRRPRLPCPPQRTAGLPHHSVLKLRALCVEFFFPSRNVHSLASPYAIGKPSCRVSMPPPPSPTTTVAAPRFTDHQPVL